MIRGVYREINGWAGTEDSAHMIDGGGNEYDVPRSRYESQSYAPPFDSLPTREEYEAARA